MAKIYRKRGNKLNEVVTFDSACTRQENQPLVYDATDGSVHTTTHINCLDANDLSVNNLTVTGQAIIQEQVTDTIDSNTLVLRSNADAGLTGTENSGVIIHNYNGSEDLYAVTDNTGTFRVGTAASTTTTYAYLRYNKVDNKWYSTAPGVTPAVEVTPVGSPTSWDSVVTSGDDAEYTNIVFSVIDRTSLEPLTTRDESTDMEKDYLTKWNATDEKIITTGTSCTHDLCANGDITSTGNITADGNVCVKTNIKVDGNSCVSGDSTVSGEIHSCKCITAPTACVSDDLYVAGDINNCNTDSIFHGSYGCFEKNVCIKGDLAIDGTIAVSSLTSDHVISVQNTTNSTFYPSFVQNNHLVAGSNDLYTNVDLQYNPSTDVLCTKTFCSDRGIVQSAFYGVTAADLGLTAGTAYSLSTIVSCLQACCGNKAVSYLFSYTDATNPKVTEYGNDYAYHLTFEKLDNNGLSGIYTKSRWLVTGANGVSWTVTGTTGSTAGSITWSVCEHVVDQVCVATAGGDLDYPLIFSACQSTPSCSKKTLFTDTANNLMYNPNTNTLKTCCINASTSLSQGNLSYKYCFMKTDNSGRTTLLVLKDISCAVCCSYCSIGIVGRVCDSRTPTEATITSIIEDVNFYIKANYDATGSSAMDIKYYGYEKDALRPVIITRNDNKVYAAMCISGSSRFLSFDTIGACSVINEVCVDSNGVYKDSSGYTYAITKAGDLATLCVNASSLNVWTADQNTNYPIVFSTCQATPTISCKTLYNDSANNLMYNPGTHNLCNINGEAHSIIADGYAKLRRVDPYIDFQLNNYTGSYTTSIYQSTRGRMSIAVNNGCGTCAATETAYFGFFSTGSFCSPRNVITPELVSPVPSAANQVSNLSFSSRCCNASSFTAYNMCLCGSNGVLYNPQGYHVPYGKAVVEDDNAVAAGTLDLDAIECTQNRRSFIGSLAKTGSIDWHNTISIRHRNGLTDGANYGVAIYQPMLSNSHWCYRQQIHGNWRAENQLIDSTGGQTIAGNLTVHNSSNNATLTADCIALTSGKVSCGLYDVYSTSITGQASSTNVALSTLVDCINEKTTIGSGDTIGFIYSNANNVCVTFPNGKSSILSGGSIQFDTLPNPITWHTTVGTISTLCGWERFLMHSTSSTSCSLIELPYIGPVDTTSLKVCDMTIASSSTTPISLTCGSYKVRIDNYDNIVIGCATSTSGSGNIAIGKTVSASSYGVALGNKAHADDRSFAVGSSACACAEDAIAIGTGARTCCTSAISIGSGAQGNSLAIGPGANSENLSSGADNKTCIVYSTIYDIFNSNDDPDLIGIVRGVKHGRIKFVIPSLSCISNIRNFFDKIFSDVINKGACMMCWTRNYNNTPTLRAELSGYYWNGAIGTGKIVSQTASGRAPTTVIHEKIYLDVSDDLASSSSICQLINSGCHVRSTSWSWTGSGFWECGMVGVIEF